MPGYISSNENRFYVARESSYGNVATIAAKNRIPAVALTAKQQKERLTRRDKTGGRTFPGLPAGVRRSTHYEVKTYMTGWLDFTAEPGYGPLFEAALGSAGRIWNGGIVSAQTDGRFIQFSAPHQLQEGQAVTFGGELRFVAAIADERSIQVNAPFTLAPTPGSHFGNTITYTPGESLGSVSLFDYWSPLTAVQRVLRGAAVNRMRIRVNDDFHEFTFSGPACDVMDSSSFSAGEGALTQFPAEPALGDWEANIIPGHLGQAWLGTAPNLFPTVTAAEFEVDNDVELRAKEFGSALPRSVVPGKRTTTVSLSLYQQDDDATRELYQAARQGSPIPVMFQFGQTSGQLFGAYLKAVVPEVPEFDDGERRLEWKFGASRAQGLNSDDIFVAFG